MVIFDGKIVSVKHSGYPRGIVLCQTSTANFCVMHIPLRRGLLNGSRFSPWRQRLRQEGFYAVVIWVGGLTINNPMIALTSKCFATQTMLEKRRLTMRKLVILLSAVFLVAYLSACATMGGTNGAKVKCPACGHEFNYVAPSELR
jgi:hypothetical protein